MRDYIYALRPARLFGLESRILTLDVIVRSRGTVLNIEQDPRYPTMTK